MPNQKPLEKKPAEKKKVNHKSLGRRQRLTLGQWAADSLAATAGSWGFIIGFVVFLIIWVALNSALILFGVWDPYPYILLNLFLSCLAAIQAPVILMSQNRAAQRDRRQAAKDYYIDRKAEKEIKVLQMQVLELKEIISKQSTQNETKRIEGEVKKIQSDLENMSKTLQIE
jgi:uncharacterized membrane protein